MNFITNIDGIIDFMMASKKVYAQQGKRVLCSIYIRTSMIESGEPIKLMKAVAIFQAIDNGNKVDLEKVLSLNTGSGFGWVTSIGLYHQAEKAMASSAGHKVKLSKV